MTWRPPREFLVVGAGPAGASASIALASSGRDVTLAAGNSDVNDLSRVPLSDWS
jgi:2-polyprenyl-6-methoxyphenol hydroxylase-like FAD-dependent oxidoreductase